VAAAESIHLTAAPATPQITGVDPDLIAYLDQRFGDIDRRFGGIDQRFDNMDRRFGEIDHQIGEINIRFGGVDRQIGDLKSRLESTDHQIGDLSSRFESVDHQFEDLRRHFDVVVESLMSKIELVGEGVRHAENSSESIARFCTSPRVSLRAGGAEARPRYGKIPSSR